MSKGFQKLNFTATFKATLQLSQSLETEGDNREYSISNIYPIYTHTGAKTNFLSRNYQKFDVWKMWILWKMRLWEMWIV